MGSNPIPSATSCDLLENWCFRQRSGGANGCLRARFAPQLHRTPATHLLTHALTFQVIVDHTFSGIFDVEPALTVL